MFQYYVYLICKYFHKTVHIIINKMLIATTDIEFLFLMRIFSFSFEVIDNTKLELKKYHQGCELFTSISEKLTYRRFCALPLHNVNNFFIEFHLVGQYPSFSLLNYRIIHRYYLLVLQSIPNRAFVNIIYS